MILIDANLLLYSFRSEVDHVTTLPPQGEGQAARISRARKHIDRPSGKRSERRWLAAGIGLTILYVMMTRLSSPAPVRILYDGFLPAPPYRWVHPPAERAIDNEPALTGTGVVAIDPLGLSLPREIQTEDEQADVTFPSGVVAIQPGQVSVRVEIIPIDPARAPAPPRGLRFDGNAYRIRANYLPSSKAVALAGPVTVVLRYPLHATVMLRSARAGWAALSTTRYPGTLEVLANSDQLGVFVAATPGSGGFMVWAPFLAAGAGVAAVIAGFILIRRRARPRTVS